jgi:hypothetical protein
LLIVRLVSHSLFGLLRRIVRSASFGVPWLYLFQSSPSLEGVVHNNTLHVVSILTFFRRRCDYFITSQNKFWHSMFQSSPSKEGVMRRLIKAGVIEQTFQSSPSKEGVIVHQIINRLVYLFVISILAFFRFNPRLLSKAL